MAHLLPFLAALALAVSAPAQVCTPDFCEVPTEGVEVAREPGVAAVWHGYADAPAFAAFIREKALGEGGGADRGGDTDDSASSGSGLLFRLLVAFVAGLALNLSPCVLPMIPVQLAVLGMGARAPSPRVGAIRGAAYGLGVALAYGTLGLAAVRGGAVFGSLQSRPAFNLVVGGVFIVLALALLDVIHIDFSRHGRRPPASLSLAGLFAFGATAALLAGACVAPAVIAALLYAAEAYAAGHRAALALPLALGCGMAAPWPFIGAGLSIMPRPGGWMRHVRHAFALVVVLMALRHFAIAARPLLPGRTAEGVRDYTEFDEAFAGARASGRPVVIDFFASWCGSCATMERTTFRDPVVRELLSRCEFLRIQVEDPFSDEAVALLARFGIRGFPAIVVVSGNAGSDGGGR